MSDTNLRPGVLVDTMPRRAIVKSKDFHPLGIVIAEAIRREQTVLDFFHLQSSVLVTSFT
jgi:hypothetical protein